MDDLVERMFTNPQRIFQIPEQRETWVEVDPENIWEIKASEMHTRCGWTPFEGWRVRGRVQRVVLRGMEVYKDGQITSSPGNGRNIRVLEK
jgi:carbamoyl-phosphate synthase/aspartate carbamoyltransferase/dihydroorotase